MKKIIIFLLTILALNATPALAQIDVSSLTNPDLSIELQPEFPRPGEKVTATLSDYGGGTYGSTISWVLDGEVIPSATNQRETSFTAGEVGVEQTIEIVLSTIQGGKKVIKNTVKPIYLDIIIEPQTRVPDFYQGRSLPSVGSLVNATALLSYNELLNSDLVYTWRLDDQVLDGGPIRQRNKVSFTTPRGDEMVLSLQVTELSGKVIAKRAIFVPSVYPTINFYEVNALLGINNRPINDNLSLIGNSVIIRAEPYNLDSRVYNNPDIKEWKINNLPSGDVGGNPYEVTLQRVGIPGKSSLQFHVRDTTQVLQGAKSEIIINF